ncbi:uncharacterized protein LOC108696373 isoform X2 [Xenopus laevis]|uniref:Uncharacterized protein LOC108696373 isoform X2 n=1 Tax=Xenopus laevis TaxID=8355 RepID=A0A8J0TBJ5_XENLA|nr:uncharacterized protein LOC108696373 isoform X2 [Xenopus laevis]
MDKRWHLSVLLHDFDVYNRFTRLMQTSYQPAFMKCIYMAIGAIADTFFKSWNKEGTTDQTSLIDMDKDSCGWLLDYNGKKAMSDLLSIHKSSDNQKRLNSWEFYKGFNLKRELENVNKDITHEDNSEETAVLEEELDGLNEEFLKLAMEALKEKTDEKLDSCTKKKDQDALLEIKRRCTAEKICSLESKLLNMETCACPATTENKINEGLK